MWLLFFNQFYLSRLFILLRLTLAEFVELKTGGQKIVAGCVWCEILFFLSEYNKKGKLVGIY